MSGPVRDVGPHPGHALAPLVGRNDERRRLGQVLREPPEVGGRAVLVVAEAGAGKTRLLDEVFVASTATRVIRVGGGELTATLPFVALRRALRHELALHEAALPEGRHAAGGPETTRANLVQGFAEIIERMTFDDRVVLVLDDAHWIDDATMAVIDLLGRQLGAIPLDLVLAARPHPEPAGFAAVRRTIERSGRLEKIVLPPLSTSHARHVTEHVLGGRCGAGVHDLVDRAGGNALLCTELGLALRTRVEPMQDGRLDLTHPSDGVSLDVIEHNVAGLGERCSNLLSDAAVLGSRFEAHELALLVGEPVEVVLDGLGPALSAGVLTEETDGAVRFRHDLVRDGVLQRIPRATVRARHRQIATTFAAAGLPTTSWAAHLRLADWTLAPDTAWHLFEQAATSTAQESLADALSLLRHARATLPGDPPLSFLGLQLELSVDTDDVDDLHELIDVLPRHLTRTAADTPADVLDVFAARALEAVWGNIMNSASRTSLRRLIGPAVDRGGPATRDALALEHHMRAACLRGEPGHVGPMLQVTDRARQRGDERLWSTAIATAFITACATEDRATAIDVGLRGIEELLDQGVRPVMAEALLTSLAFSMRVDDQTIAPLERRLRRFDHLGPPMSVALGLLQVGPKLAAGDWEEAVDLVDDFVEWDDDHGHCNLRLTTRATLPVLVYAGVGRFEDARRVLEPGAVDPRRLTRREWLLYASTHHRDRALVDVLAGGDWEADLETAFELRLADDDDRACDRELPLYVATAALAGRDDLVRAYDERVAGRVALTSTHARLLDVLTGRANEWQTVAAPALARHDFPVVLATTGAAVATASTGTEARTACVEVLRTARAHAASCGAATWRDRCDDRLAELGVTVIDACTAPQPTHGLAALTPAERRVLPLMLDGLLYREIAEELHNSRRTIESHAASILRKLGVSTRRDLGDAVTMDDVTAGH